MECKIPTVPIPQLSSLTTTLLPPKQPKQPLRLDAAHGGNSTGLSQTAIFQRRHTPRDLPLLALRDDEDKVRPDGVFDGGAD